MNDCGHNHLFAFALKKEGPKLFGRARKRSYQAVSDWLPETDRWIQNLADFRLQNVQGIINLSHICRCGALPCSSGFCQLCTSTNQLNVL